MFGHSGFRGIVSAAVLVLSVGFAAAEETGRIIEAKLPDDTALINLAFAPTTGPTSIPIGHMDFCRQSAAECRGTGSAGSIAVLTEGRWRQLVDVNNHFNTTIIPMTDEDQWGVAELWSYPDTGYGDCEDFALAKRRELIRLGWNPATLLMSVVREVGGAGHAVLMVRTDRGDFILDNQTSMIKVWNETDYQFVKRQSQTDPSSWVSIEDGRHVTIVSSTAN